MYRSDFSQISPLAVGKAIAVTLVFVSFASCFVAQAQSQHPNQDSSESGYNNRDSPNQDSSESGYKNRDSPNQDSSESGYNNRDSEDSESGSSNINLKASLNFVEPPVSSSFGDPGQRTAAGARGGCRSTHNELTASKGKQLTALVPVYGQKDPELVFGETTSSHPTFWFYVPYSSPLSAKFVLQDEQHKTIYQTPISLARTPGVINFPLPSKTAPLKVNQRYHWFLNIYCNQGKPPAFVDGWIKRKELNPSLKTELELATLSQRVSLLATHGIWYDALTISAQLRRQKLNRHDWAAMLKAVGLENIAFEPIVGAIDNGKISYQDETELVHASNRREFQKIP